jgi:hypothetical protein
MTLNSIACKGVIEVSPRFPTYVTIARVRRKSGSTKTTNLTVFLEARNRRVPTEQPIFSSEDLGRGSAV